MTIQRSPHTSSIPVWSDAPSPRQDASAQHDVVVVIPAYNEERFVASVVMMTKGHADHVIVVDDGSTDQTAALAEGAGAQVVRQGVNKGKAQALNAGFAAARALSPRVVICLDADAQHDPSEIPALADPILAGDADVVIGSRFLDVKSDIPRWRQVGQHTLTQVTNTLSGVHVTDSQSGYRAFSPTALNTLRFLSNGLSLESEMQFLLEASGLRVSEVAISVKYLDGNKRNPVLHGMEVLDSMLRLVARRRPLLFVSFPGVLVLLAGLIVGLYVTASFASTGVLMIGLTILTATLMMVGMLISITGVLLHTLGHFVSTIRGDLEALVARHGADAPTDRD